MEKETNLENVFLVVFWGNFIPLQGVQYIVKAVKLLEKYPDIQFQLIGEGQDYRKILDLANKLNLKNINFVGRVDYKDLPNYIDKANICLGIFGDTQKTQRVIPNKVYEAIAMRKPVISADTPAIRELFIDKKNILFCRTADPKDLAEKILELKNRRKLRDAIVRGGYEIFKKYATPKLIGKNLLEVLKN